jgi:RNA 2',3'-cyclic 3'-phosphodiesterase
MNGIRSFVAVEMPPDVKQELGKIQIFLRQAAACPAKWVAPESIHLTLSFLGEISPAQVEAVKGVMDKIAVASPVFNLSLDHVGAFPNLRQPQTVWVGIQGDMEILSRLHKNLEESLRVTGYKPEDRAFKPHLTLARVRDEASVQARQSLGEALVRVPGVKSGIISVTEISMFESELTRSGPMYTRLHRAKINQQR